MSLFGNLDVTDLDPVMFYGLVDLMKTVDGSLVETLTDYNRRLTTFVDELDRQSKTLEDACQRLSFETGRVTRRKGGFRGEFNDDEGRDTMGGAPNFLALVLVTINNVRDAARNIQTVAAGLQPGKPVLRKARFTGEVAGFEELQHMVAEFQLNMPMLRRFSTAVQRLGHLKTGLLRLIRELTDGTEAYRRRLQHRHERDGMEIHTSPVATDVAVAIFENIDSHGEIEHGKKPDELSAYSIRRAIALTEGVRSGVAMGFVADPEEFTRFVCGNLRALWTFAVDLEKEFSEILDGGRGLLPDMREQRQASDSEVRGALSMLEDLDPNKVTYKESTSLLTPEERYYRNFTNETVKKIVKMLGDKKVTNDALVRYVLDRKAQLHDYYKDENSFYVCKIGQGNSFTGDAPGALTVIPGTKPTVNLDEIFGSGYADLRRHVEHIEATAKWHDLFVATSPSKTADKSNVLMIGPQGCGKCVTGDTLVFTDRGLRPIQDLAKQAPDTDGYSPLEVQVLGHEGAARSSHFYDSGVQPTFKLRTRGAFSVEGTAKHRVIVAGTEGSQWKRLDEVVSGDYVALVREGLPFGTKQVDADKAYALGYYVGDGSVAYQRQEPRYMRYSVGAEDFADFEENVMPAVAEHFGTPHAYPDRDGFDVQVFGTSREQFAEVLRGCGHGADNKRVPEEILEGGREGWRGFLQGLFDADGSAYGDHLELGLNSQECLRTVQVMLTAFGIISTLQPRKSKKKGWRLNLYGDNIRRFYFGIGFRLKRKQHRIVPLLNKRPNPNHDCVPISKQLWGSLKREAGPLPRRVHKMLDAYVRRDCLPSRERLGRILVEMGFTEEESPAYLAVRELADARYCWEKVVECAPTGECKPVYDLVVPEGHSFAANGMMNHNTEVLRGVGSYQNAVGIFAVGSDFNTCWSGEAEKNPKRLFEAAIKLQKESGKHVHILLDEIDDVLADDDRAQRKHVSLRLQFQQLMDGVVHYPRVTIWGSTNNVERIPMPMIRRFSKVAIVGELNQSDRVVTLRHFVEHLPTDGYKDDAWEAQARRLEGATGDVIRKVVDFVWREKISSFVEGQPTEAEAMRRWLNPKDTKFTISEFTAERRAEFKTILRNFVSITPAEIDRSIEIHLDNVAIHNEIKTAVATYEDARRFLASARETRVV